MHQKDFLSPLYTKHKMVIERAHFKFILSRNLVPPAYRLISVQTASWLKQIKEALVDSRVTHRVDRASFVGIALSLPSPPLAKLNR